MLFSLNIKRRLRHTRCPRILKGMIAGACVMVTVVYFVIPLIFHLSPALQMSAIYANQGPDNPAEPLKEIDFSKPSNEGLPGTRNFYVTTDAINGVKIGVWHILPESYINKAPIDDSRSRDEFFQSSLNNGENIIIYLHGNNPSRATFHRVELYTVLRKLNCHVIAFDYRGYADSTKTQLTESGLVADVKAIYSYVTSMAKTSSAVFVWSHSLGTGIGSHAVAELCRVGRCPAGFVLQAAFNNLADEIRSYPLLAIYKHLPIFDWLFIEPYINQGVKFDSEGNIAYITCPILQLHARDDAVIPFRLGVKLYEAAKKKRGNIKFGPHKFIDFDAKYEYGHSLLCRSPELPKIVRHFLDETIAWNLKSSKAEHVTLPSLVVANPRQ